MSLLRKFKISTRLTVSYATLLILLICISTLAITTLKRSSSFSEKLILNDVAQGILAADVQHLAQASAITLLLILNNENREERILLYKKMDAYNKQLDDILSEMTMDNDETLNPQLSNIVKLRAAYSKDFLETVDFVEWDPESALKQFNQNTNTSLNNLLSAIQNYLSAQNKATLDSFQQTNSNSLQSINLMTGLSVAAVIIGILLAMFVSRSIVRPIRSAVVAANRMSKGDLRFEDDRLGKDEVSELTAAFAMMSSELSALVSTIHGSALQVQGSSLSLDSSVEQIAQVSNTQLEAVNSITDRVDHFTQQSTQAALTTNQAKDQAENAKQLAATGQQLIAKATQDFDVISDSIKSSVEAVETLKKRSVAVRDLVTTVSEIAKQTNLLALNAAIEAARAGESGRGFSVVADEVRNLASRTEIVTSEINTEMDAMDQETATSVQRIGRGREELEAGILLIGEMVEPLNALNEDAKASVEQLDLLQSAVSSQASDSEQISLEVQKIKQTAANNQGAIVEVSEITNSLGKTSQALEENVSKFSLEQQS